MILTDVNLLLYAYDATSPHHRKARPWLEERLSGVEAFGLAWTTMLEFVRLVTNPRVFEAPLRIDETLDIVDAWLAAPCTTVLDPGSRHSALLRQLLGPLGGAANLTTDAHLAALAIEYEAVLCSADADFSRFPGLRWANPLAA